MSNRQEIRTEKLLKTKKDTTRLYDSKVFVKACVCLCMCE